MIQQTLLQITILTLIILFVGLVITKYITFRFSFSDTQKYILIDFLYYTKRHFQSHKIIILLGYFSQSNLLIICNKHFLK